MLHSQEENTLHKIPSPLFVYSNALSVRTYEQIKNGCELDNWNGLLQERRVLRAARASAFTVCVSMLCLETFLVIFSKLLFSLV